MRRITITIEETTGLGSRGSASVTIDSNLYGHGTVAAQIGEVAQGVMNIWSAVDSQSCQPKPDGPTGRPRPAPRDDR
jgi:hypothetical protein